MLLGSLAVLDREADGCSLDNRRMGDLITITITMAVAVATLLAGGLSI